MPKDPLSIEAFNHCLRYGNIEHDSRWDEEEGHYKGSNRLVVVALGKWRYTFEMLNGEVIRASKEV
jgi:hypothetical protein